MWRWNRDRRLPSPSCLPSRALPTARALRNGASAALALWALTCVVPRSVRSTTFVLMDEATLLQTSDLVLTATTTAIETAAAPGADSPIYTYIHLEPGRLIKGALDGSTPLVLREPGGRFGDRQEWIYGAPEFWVGDRSLLFLERAADGTLHTSSLALGKFTVGVDAAGRATAVRDYGHGAAVLDPATGQLLETTPQAQRLLPLLKRLHHTARADPRRRHTPRTRAIVPPELAGATTEVQDAYTFLGSPSRWFEPDCGLPVNYPVDSTGDLQLGLNTSRAAVDAALAAWTNVPTASLVIQDGGLTTASAFAGCGTNRIVFNDPFNEITDPTDCGGVLAIGGFCTSGGNPCNPPSSSVINGTTFNRIVTGKVTVNNGWGSCAVWTQCNLSEVLTHEIGHTIGFGHSADTSATMAATAHFDGRCAGLASDDVAAITFAYPAVGTPLPSPTSTRTPTPVPTAPATQTFTALPTFTPTRTLTSSPTATPSPAGSDITGQITYYSNAQPVIGVGVQLIGAVPASTQSDISGQYLFTNVSGSAQIVPQKLGDFGAGISALDAVYILQALGGERMLTAAQLLACDVTGNGSLSPLDAALVLQYKVGLINKFPVAQACASDWAFIPTAAASASEALVNPTISTGNCQPGAVTFQAPLAPGSLDQDFTAVLFGDCTGNWQPSTLQAPLIVKRSSGNAATGIHLGRARRVGGQLRIPLSVQDAGALYAFDGLIDYDAEHLRWLGVHHAQGALVAVRPTAPGTLALAVASGHPLPRGTVLSLNFAMRSRPAGRAAAHIRHLTVARAERRR